MLADTEHNVLATSSRVPIRNIRGLEPFYFAQLTNFEQNNRLNKTDPQNKKIKLEEKSVNPVKKIHQDYKPSLMLDIAINSKLTSPTLTHTIYNLRRSNVLKIVPLTLSTTVESPHTNNLSNHKKKLNENYEINRVAKETLYSIYGISNSSICANMLTVLTGYLNNDNADCGKMYASIRSSLYNIYTTEERRDSGLNDDSVIANKSKNASYGILQDLVNLSALVE